MCHFLSCFLYVYSLISQWMLQNAIQFLHGDHPGDDNIHFFAVSSTKMHVIGLILRQFYLVKVLGALFLSTPYMVQPPY